MTFKGDNSSGVVVTTAVAAPVAATNDIEAQNKAANAAAASRQNPCYPPMDRIRNSPNNNVDGFDPEAGKTLGIAMFVLLLVALICTFFVPIVSFVALIATIVIASCIACNCCCASDYRLHPKRKKFATATLVSLCMMFIVQIIWVIAVATAVGTEASNTGTVSQSTADATTTSAIIIVVLSLVFNVLAIIFSALFTWNRP